MKSDLEIAQVAKMKKIQTVAKSIGLKNDESRNQQ